MPDVFPPLGPVTQQKTIPSYLYQQFSDDDDLQAFITAYNGISQYYLDWFNNINLPVYTSAQIKGPLLDWVGETIYGLPRPSFSTGTLTATGAINTSPLDVVAINDSLITGLPSYVTANDDIYKRTLTWHYYKGDGKYFTIPWLKRRISRFLNGHNGTSPAISTTPRISVAFSGGVGVAITITTTNPTSKAIALVFAAGVSSGILELPFQYAFTVTLV